MNDYISRKTTTSFDSKKVEKSQTIQKILLFILGIVEILLIFRLVFKLSGANPTSGLVNWIYSVTKILILPFSGIFRQVSGDGIETTSLLEPATIIGIVIYAVLTWGIVQLVTIVSRRQS